MEGQIEVGVQSGVFELNFSHVAFDSFPSLIWEAI